MQIRSPLHIFILLLLLFVCDIHYGQCGDCAVFATMSARVGSVTHNELGGWYAYRASKAATNMLVKTIAIEARTRLPNWRVVALHPGTVQSALSEPFTRYRFHALTLSRSHTHLLRHTHSLTHSRTHSLNLSLSLSLTHTHKHTRTHTHSCKRARTHVRTH